MSESAGEVTVLLKAMAGGDESARDQLLPLQLSGDDSHDQSATGSAARTAS